MNTEEMSERSTVIKEGVDEPEHTRKLFVGGLNLSSNEEKLKTHFENWGEIVACIVVRDSHTKRSKGFGFVTFKKAHMVHDAIAAAPHRIEGREIGCREAVPRQGEYEPEQIRKLFVGGLTFRTTEQMLKSHFEQWGEVVGCVVVRDFHTKRSKGFGFITYKKAHMIDDAQAARPHTIDGWQVLCQRAVPRQDPSKTDARISVNRVFVGQLGNDVEEADLEEYFGKFGKIINVDIVRDKKGKKRGFAFIDFDDYDPVDKIVLMRRHYLKGKRALVEKAVPREVN